MAKSQTKTKTKRRRTLFDEDPIIVYVAGPYRAPTKAGRECNIQKAAEAAKAVWRAGAAAICPHMNSAHFDGVAPEERFLTAYLYIVDMCDAVFATRGWHHSPGSRDEVAKAELCGVPVVYSIRELRALMKDIRARAGEVPDA